jgi:glycosidase
MYDLGEFDQKDSVRTKYGTKDEYLKAIATAQQAGIQVYADVVLNHMMGADEAEEVEATPYSPDNRHHPIGDRPQNQSLDSLHLSWSSGQIFRSGMALVALRCS